MIIDTNGIDCMIVRENEIGIYDTSRVTAVYSVTLGTITTLRLKTGEEFRLQFPKEKLIERVTK